MHLLTLKLYLLCSSDVLNTPWSVGPCHQGMVRPQVADAGMASNMEGRGEYTE